MTNEKKTYLQIAQDTMGSAAFDIQALLQASLDAGELPPDVAAAVQTVMGQMQETADPAALGLVYLSLSLVVGRVLGIDTTRSILKETSAGGTPLLLMELSPDACVSLLRASDESCIPVAQIVRELLELRTIELDVNE